MRTDKKTLSLAEFNKILPEEPMPVQPESPKLGNADKLLQRIRTQRPDLLTRPNFMILHQRQCASASGGFCNCDVRAAVDGTTLRLRD